MLRYALSKKSLHIRYIVYIFKVLLYINLYFPYFSIFICVNQDVEKNYMMPFFFSGLMKIVYNNDDSNIFFTQRKYEKLSVLKRIFIYFVCVFLPRNISFAALVGFPFLLYFCFRKHKKDNNKCGPTQKIVDWICTEVSLLGHVFLLWTDDFFFDSWINFYYSI